MSDSARCPNGTCPVGTCRCGGPGFKDEVEGKPLEGELLPTAALPKGTDPSPFRLGPTTPAAK